MQETEEKVMQDSKKYAESKGFSLNSDEKILNLVIKALAKNTEEKGRPYCPCRPLEGIKEQDDKKVCPCAWHLKEIEEDGHCKCRLFYAKQ